MNPEEINEMMKWFSENIDKLNFGEQMKFGMAVSECIDKLKPIYLKHIAFDGEAKFLFKM